MIQLRLDAAGETPDLVLRAQLSSVEARRWEQGERIGEQPVVYPARGCHACYFSPGLHWTGLWFDRADGKGPAPVLNLEVIVTTIQAQRGSTGQAAGEEHGQARARQAARTRCLRLPRPGASAPVPRSGRATRQRQSTPAAAAAVCSVSVRVTAPYPQCHGPIAGVPLRLHHAVARTAQPVRRRTQAHLRCRRRRRGPRRASRTPVDVRRRGR
jgi:hypothetical protein